MPPDPSKSGPPRRPPAAAGRPNPRGPRQSDVPPVIEPAPRRKRRRSSAPLVLGLVAVAAVMAGLLFVLLGPGREPPARKAATSQGEVAGSAPTPADPSAAPDPAIASGEDEQPSVSGRYLVVDTGRMPWAPPTSGPRPRLDYLPPGSQLVLLCRPADLLAQDEGPLLLRGLGPVADATLKQLAAWCGCEPGDIEFIQAGWQGGGPDEVLGGVAVRLTAGHQVPGDDASRKAAWGATTDVSFQGQTYHRGQGHSFWVPEDEGSRVLVVVSESPRAPSAGPAGGGSPLIEDTVRAALEARGLPATELAVDLPRDLAVLVGMLDAERHVTLFGTPHFLVNRGRVALAGPLANLLEPLRGFFGESLAAAALSLHVGDTCYLEFDAVTPFAQPPRKEAPAVFDRLAAVPGTVEAAIASMNLDPYGKILVLRLPAMLRMLVAEARWAPEGEGLVINAYLPEHAAHNLIVATELALAQAAGAGPPVATRAAAEPGRRRTAGEALDQRITLVFPRDTLEMAVQFVAEQAGIPLEIMGPDLQLEGITKNQSFGLDERDKPAREVLQTILAKANPDGKLVYVVRQADSGESILITTRAAAEKRGDSLPAEFAPPAAR